MKTAVPEMPFVTCVIPCRNEAGFIATCLDSVVELDWPTERLEVLVCDGVSSDRTMEIAKDYAKAHPPVSYTHLTLPTNREV